jgi:hypothetical protein
MGTLLVLGLFSACNSPTLPTPPPVDEPPQLDIPDAELAADGEHVDVTGHALPGATVIALNRSLLDSNVHEASAVAIASLEDGTYHAQIRVDLRCVDKNIVDIFQRDLYGRFSPPRTFKAPNGIEDGAVPPNDASCSDAGPIDAATSDGDNGADGGVDGASG